LLQLQRDSVTRVLFPRSVLPRFCRVAFSTFIFFAAAALCAIFLKSM
jgi:hypothetical protein